MFFMFIGFISLVVVRCFFTFCEDYLWVLIVVGHLHLSVWAFGEYD